MTGGQPQVSMPAFGFAEWMTEAACTTDDATWFPSPGRGRGNHKRMAAVSAPAKAVCAECPVRAECLAYALKTRQRHGVWGGLDQLELRDLHRRGAVS